MLKWKRLLIMTTSVSILLTQGGPLPYLAYAMEEASHAPINGEVNFSWTTSDQVTLGSTFNPYEGLEAIDADGDNVAVLSQVEGDVNTKSIGVYPVTYSIQNVDGETFTVTRQIEVVELNTSEDETTEEVSSESQNGQEQVLDEDMKQEIETSPLKDVMWTLYDRSTEQELIKLNVNVETGLYEGQLIEDLKSLLENVDEETLNQDVLKLRILTSQQVEKIAITLTVNDLLGETDVLKVLNELPYEMDDQVSITPLLKEKTILVVNGVIGGDISKEKEDYSDGVESEDLINNVRFILQETGLSTLYNEAPVIEGIEDTVVTNFETFDPKSGVIVKDDHDENLFSHLAINTEKIDENTHRITYKVTDSWGRTTEAIRQITEEAPTDYSINPITDEESAPQTTLGQNIIEVHGISYDTTGSNTLRMKVIFNQNKRRIYVTDQDGLRFNSRIKDTYFKMILFSNSGRIKNSVEVLGTDKSSVSALDELTQQGWRFEYGDRIMLWHNQSDRKLIIQGNVNHNGEVSFDEGFPSSQLSSTRFELTPTGLDRITNEPPMITFEEGMETIHVLRGDRVDLLDGVIVTDNDQEGGESNLTYNQFDTSVLGNHEVTYTVTDEWGLTTSKTRYYKVVPKNKIEEVKISILSNATELFTLSFDEILSELKAEVSTSNQTFAESTTESDVILNVYTNEGKLSRSFTIPTDASQALSVMDEINGYLYKSGDYINITTSTPSRIRINGDITDLPEGVDYTNGLSGTDQLQNVRFELATDGTFKYKYNQAPEFQKVEYLTITRGQAFNYTDGMTIQDDHDGTIELTDDRVRVVVNSGNPDEVGEVLYTVTYTDSWGRSSQVNRKLIVNPATALEKSQIKLTKGQNDFLTIGFDELTKSLKVISYSENDWIQGNESDIAFQLKLYGSNKEIRQTISLYFQEALSQSFIKEIENMNYSEGDYLTVSAYRPEELQVLKSITETVTFENEEKMLHSRLELQKTGLEVIYNKAPIFQGTDDVSIVYGTEFVSEHKVSVSDEDSNLSFEVVGEVDSNQLGTQTLVYKTKDTYGRETIITRKVTVVPVYTTNKVEYYDERNQLKFAIGINASATGFTVELPSSSTQLNMGGTNEEFVFNVYNAEGVLVTEVKITESTEINEELFATLKSTIVRPGYRFSVTASDLTKLKITGQIEKSNQSQPTDVNSEELNNQSPLTNVNYGELNENHRDVVDNVRFELTENIIEAIYNAAPVLSFKVTEESDGDSTEPVNSESNPSSIPPLMRDKALTKEAYNLLEGIQVSDDKDSLTLEIKDVTVPEEMLYHEIEQSVTTIGETYDVTYQVIDSWGRKSNVLTRQVQIKSAMDDVEIIMHHQPKATVDPTNKAFTVGFNFSENQKRWTITKDEGVQSSDTIEGNSYPAYALVVTDKNEEKKFNYLFGGRQNDIINTSRYEDEANTISDIQEALESLNTLDTLDYGTVIELRNWKEYFLVINGTIIDEKEDYSAGATIDEYLMNSTFIVSPEGLRQVYTPQAYKDEYQRITWFNGINGLKECSLVFNQETKAITFEQDTNQLYDIKAEDENAFIIKFHYQNGEIKTYSATGGNDNGNANSPKRPNHFKAWLTAQGINSYTNLDYITLTPREPRIRNMRVEGNISYHGMVKEDNDFSQGATSMDYFTNTRFYLRENGIIAVYNKAPVFTGVDELNVIQNQVVDLRENVSVSDDYDNNIAYEVNPATISTSEIGTQTVTYRSTDNWGRRTEVIRTINSRPALYGNQIQVYNNQDKNTPAFEIFFDNQATVESGKAGKFKLKVNSADALNNDLPAETIFRMEIYGADRNQKLAINLLGRDTANSSKLDSLKNYEYEEGDYLHIWMRPTSESTNVDTLKITGTISGEVGDKEDYADGIDNIEYMNNVFFKIRNTGLESIYNQAPVIQGAKDTVVYFGDDFNPLTDVTVTDDKDNEGNGLSISDRNVTSNVNTNRIGSYTVTYTVTDSWGRTSSKTITVKVISKVTKNTFEIYQSVSSTKNKQTLVTIGFNEEANRLVINPESSAPTIVSEDSASSRSYLQFTIYNRFGRIKGEFSFSEDDLANLSSLEQLTNILMENGDMISIVSQTPANVAIKGGVVNHTDTYENGFTTVEQMQQVRFKVTNSGLEEIKQAAMNILITGTPIITQRTMKPDFFEGIEFNHPNEEISNDQVKVSGYDLSQIGEQTITYTVTDSWGQQSTATRVLIVEPYNELEEVSVKLKDQLNASRLMIGFDSVQKTLKANLVTNSSLKTWLQTWTHSESFPQDVPVVEIAIFSSSQELRNKIVFMASDLVENNDKINDINQLTFNYGEYLGINVYNYENGIEMSGPIIEPKMVYNAEGMQSVRYRITENGLWTEYNQAPDISLTSDSHPVSEEINFKELVEITDDRDSGEDVLVKIDTNDYDLYKIGKYTITITATDRWDNKKVEEFDFYVTSDLEEVTATFQSNQGEEIATLSFDSRTQRLKWTFNEENEDSFISGSTEPSEERSSDTNEPSVTNNLFNIHIYDEKGSKLTTVLIEKEDTARSFKEKLKHYLDYQYHYGYYLNVEVLDNLALDCIRINNVNSGLSSKLEDIDYTKKLQSSDYFTNVRFELDEYGLYAIYNEAPELLSTGSDKLSFIKNVDVEAYGLLSNLKVNDDHDSLDTESIEVLYNGNKESSSLQLGSNTITYTAIDSWGRRSESIKRTLTLLTAMNDVSIEMYHQSDTTVARQQQVLDIKFVMDNESETSGKLLVINPNQEQDQFIKPVSAETFPAYAIRITGQSEDGNTIKYQKLLGGSAGNQFITDSEAFGGSTNSVNAVIAELNDMEIEYGDQIELRTYLAGYLVVKGQVVNAQEDYSQGAYIDDILSKSVFTVTKNGLEQQYNNTTTADEGTNKLVWLSGAAGSTTVELTMTHPTITRSTGTFSVNIVRNQRFDVTSSGGEVFKFTHYRKGQNAPILEFIANGGSTGTTAEEFQRRLNGHTFQQGDYFRVTVKSTLKNNIRLYGETNRIGESIKDVSYTESIPDINYYNEAYFYFDEQNQLTIFYNEAPKFIGLDDIIILKEKNGPTDFDIDLLENVSIEDEDKDIDYDIKDSNGIIIDNPEEYTVSGSGIKRVTYEATDSLGRETIESRFIWIQQQSELSVENESKLIIQESDPSLQTQEQKFEYLKSLVNIYDQEDYENNIPMEFKENDITGTLDVNKTGDYPIHYKYQDSDGNITTLDLTVQVVRSINVTVPKNNIPFQVVTNLLGEDTKGKEFISGTVKIQNNYVTDVNVSVKSLEVKSDAEQSSTRNGIFDLVQPDSMNWNNLSEEETMSKMALGLYHKSGLNGNNLPTKDNPIWLTTDMGETTIGVLPKRELTIDESDPTIQTLGEKTEAVLSFTAKYGKNFISGKHRMNFTMILEFE